MIITISMTSTAAARNVVTKTAEWLTATSPAPGPARRSLSVQPGTTRLPRLALQLLGTGDVGVSRVEWE
jgi:hypothetical protein